MRVLLSGKNGRVIFSPMGMAELQAAESTVGLVSVMKEKQTTRQQNYWYIVFLIKLYIKEATSVG